MRKGGGGGGRRGGCARRDDEGRGLVSLHPLVWQGGATRGVRQERGSLPIVASRHSLLRVPRFIRINSQERGAPVRSPHGGDLCGLSTWWRPVPVRRCGLHIPHGAPVRSPHGGDLCGAPGAPVSTRCACAVRQERLAPVSTFAESEVARGAGPSTADPCKPRHAAQADGRATGRAGIGHPMRLRGGCVEAAWRLRGGCVEAALQRARRARRRLSPSTAKAAGDP